MDSMVNNITIDETYSGLIDEGWRWRIEGSIYTDGWLHINLNKPLYVSGDIKAGGYIEAGGYIKAGRYIKAGEYIKAGGYIEAGGDIKAGGYIEAGRYIKASEYIEAGEYIKASEYIFSFSFSIMTKFIITKRLPFWRKFWADMPPLKKWRKEILNYNNCWDDLRRKVSRSDAKKICAWDGWHWILRAQLEMFFGLKDKYIISEADNA